MLLHRLLRRVAAILIVCLFGTNVSYVTAANHIPGTSQLGGWVYIDRNNDGVLAFSNEPQPEFVIGGVEIRLFSIVGSLENLVATQLSDDLGRYFFNALSPGTYTLRQTQPVEYVDGLDTLGTMLALTSGGVPPSASSGTMSNNAFSNIVLPANVRGDYFNFGERGMAPGFVSKRYLLGSSPVMQFALVPEPATLVVAVVTAGSWLLLLRRRKV